MFTFPNIPDRLKDVYGNYNKISFVSLDPPALPTDHLDYIRYLNYVKATYLEDVPGKFIFNENFKDRYKLDDAGAYILSYIDYNNSSLIHYIKVEDPPLSGTFIYIDYKSVQHYQFDDPGYSPNSTGGYIRVSGNYIKVTDYISLNNEYVLISGKYYNTSAIDPKDRYNYDPIWGFGFNQNSTGPYLRVYISDNEDHYILSGVDYNSGAGPYIRVYTPDSKVTWAWSAFWKDFVASAPGQYPEPPIYQGARKRYKFDGTKFIRDDSTGTFIQEFDSPVGYWTYSSKLLIDNNYNTSEYGWIVYHQNGGTFGVNMSSYSLKVKEDLSFEKQFVRCVSGGQGDDDDL